MASKEFNWSDYEDVTHKEIENTPSTPPQEQEFNWENHPELTVDPEEHSMLGSGLLGAIQGGSLGFADEAEAGVRSALSTRKYDDLIKEIRARYNSAKEQNPLSYGTGELASAFAVPIPGMGATKGASLLARLASATGKGALIGGTTGLGTSEASLKNNPLEVAKDVGGGAAMGGILGGTLHGAGELIGAGAKKVLGTKIGQRGEVAFKSASAGEDLGLSKLEPTQNKQFEDILKRVGNLEKQKGVDIKDVVSFLDEGAPVTDIMKISDKVNSELSNTSAGTDEWRNLSSIKKVLDSYKQRNGIGITPKGEPGLDSLMGVVPEKMVTSVTPNKAEELKKELNSLYSGMDTGIGKSTIADISGGIQKDMAQGSPTAEAAISGANKEYGDTQSMKELLKLGSLRSTDAADQVSNVKSLRDLTGNLAPWKGYDAAMQGRYSLGQATEQIASSEPKFASDLTSELTEMGKKLDVSRKLSEPIKSADRDMTSKLLGVTESGALHVAYGAGKIDKLRLDTLANIEKTIPHLAPAMRAVISSPNSQKGKAALFILLQNPEVRRMLNPPEDKNSAYGTRE